MTPCVRWREKEYTFEDAALRALVEGEKRLILVTAHRRENWGEPMAHIARAVARIASEFTDSEIVLAMHRNPIVRETLTGILGTDGARPSHRAA